MSPLFYQQIINNIVERSLLKQHPGHIPNQQQLAQASRNLRFDITRSLKDVLFIVIGVTSAAFGLSGFLLPNAFIDGGVTGISLLVEVVTGISLAILLPLINLPFLLLGARTISRSFAVKSIVAITLLAIVVHFVQFPTITDDKLLIAVFGGFFLGMGIGMSIRGGAVIDGTEVLAVWLSRRTSLTVGDIILVLNLVIFAFGAYILSLETALYAILTYLSASKTVDFIIDGVEEYIGVTIISNFSDEVRLAIIEKMGRGVTIYNGKGGFGKRGEELTPMDVVFTVVTRLELSKLKTEVDKIDPDAFMVMGLVKDAKGGMIKKRPLK
ncbi:MAG: YitT family protein [Saprospiraceae bacterium]|nr:YitT family protein [Saprospiraceae bacterium]